MDIVAEASEAELLWEYGPEFGEDVNVVARLNQAGDERFYTITNSGNSVSLLRDDAYAIAMAILNDMRGKR